MRSFVLRVLFACYQKFTNFHDSPSFKLFMCKMTKETKNVFVLDRSVLFFLYRFSHEGKTKERNDRPKSSSFVIYGCGSVLEIDLPVGALVCLTSLAVKVIQGKRTLTQRRIRHQFHHKVLFIRCDTFNIPSQADCFHREAFPFVIF